jgi:hypothetical protein
MPVAKRLLPVTVVLAALALLFAVLSAPGSADAADHLDGGSLVPAGGDPQADINDLYVFDAATAGKTALILTTNPLAGVVSPESFGTDVVYMFRVDTNGDARADIAYKLMFGAVDGSGDQAITVKRAIAGAARANDFSGTTIATGTTGKAFRSNGLKAWAGLASDPFFFDLEGFLGSVEGVGTRMFLDGNETDFFDGLNVMGITLQVRDSDLGGGAVGVWGATTNASTGAQLDRQGIPAINTVFNAAAFGGPKKEKQFYNRRNPVTDVAKFHDLFSDRMVAFTTSLGAPYTAGEADGIMDLLLPDILSYDVTTPAAGPLNGRRLEDDVIDIELGIVTNGVVPGDGIGPHTDYRANFPYLGKAN